WRARGRGGSTPGRPALSRAADLAGAALRHRRKPIPAPRLPATGSPHADASWSSGGYHRPPPRGGRQRDDCVAPPGMLVKPWKRRDPAPREEGEAGEV